MLTNQQCQIVVHLFEGRLYIEVVNRLISVLYWQNKLRTLGSTLTESLGGEDNEEEFLQAVRDESYSVF